jgi:multidrug resistance efflux pump
MATPPRDSVPFRIPFRHRVRRRLRRLPALIIWSAALAGAVVLYIRQEQGITVTGFADEVSYMVAPEEAGRLKRLEVEVDQEVTRGQIIASIENGGLLLELSEARTELDRLAFELGREEALWKLSAAGQQTDQQTNLRRFARDVEMAHIEYLEGLTGLAEDRITLQGLEITLNRSRLLQESDVSSLATLDADRIAFESLAEKIAGMEAAVEEMKRRYDDSNARYAEFAAEYMMEIPSSNLILKPLEYAVKVQEVRIEQANLAITRFVLRAPAAGRVAKIHRRPGEVVAAGEPVVSVVEPQAGWVTAYLPEHRILDVAPGSEVTVSRKAAPREQFRSRVAFLGGAVERLPERVTPGGVVPEWGLAVHIPLPDPVGLKPGEAVVVTF